MFTLTSGMFFNAVRLAGGGPRSRLACSCSLLPTTGEIFRRARTAARVAELAPLHKPYCYCATVVTGVQSGHDNGLHFHGDGKGEGRMGKTTWTNEMIADTTYGTHVILQRTGNTDTFLRQRWWREIEESRVCHTHTPSHSHSYIHLPVRHNRGWEHTSTSRDLRSTSLNTRSRSNLFWPTKSREYLDMCIGVPLAVHVSGGMKEHYQNQGSTPKTTKSYPPITPCSTPTRGQGGHGKRPFGPSCVWTYTV